jgi:hypothetical protein
MEEVFDDLRICDHRQVGFNHQGLFIELTQSVHDVYEQVKFSKFQLAPLCAEVVKKLDSPLFPILTPRLFCWHRLRI